MTYLIIGNGRVATHFEHYLTLKHISSLSWSRAAHSPSDLKKLFEQCDVTLLLISDPSIEAFLSENSFLNLKPVVHFSGSHVSELAIGMHPLMSFTENKYPLTTYESIPFVCEKGRSTFNSIFPDLKNPHYEINVEEKPLYHAISALAGNGTVMLWQKLSVVFDQLGLPFEVAVPYLNQVAQNIVKNPQTALTGPVVRGDTKTLKKHFDALKSDAFQTVYIDLVKAVSPSLAKEIP